MPRALDTLPDTDPTAWEPLLEAHLQPLPESLHPNMQLTYTTVERPDADLYADLLTYSDN